MPTASNPADPIAAQQARIARRQAVAAALTQAGLQGPPQGQTVSGHYVGPGILGALAPLLSAIAGDRVAAKADKESASLATQVQGQRSAELQALRNLTPNDAIAAALTSNDPQIQAYGAELSKRTPGLKEGIGITGVDPAAAIEALNSGDPTKLRAAPPKPIEVNGQLIDPTTGQVSGDYRTKGGETLNIGGDLYQKLDDGTYKKLDNAPKTNVTVQTPDFVKSLAERDEIQRLGTTLNEKISLPSDLQNGFQAIGEARKAIQNGTLQGLAADAVEFAQEVGASFGVERTKELLNTQRFKGAILPTILFEVQKLRPASDIDVKFIEKNIGNAAKDPRIVEEILQRYERVAKSAGAEYNQRVKQFNSYLGRDSGYSMIPEETFAGSQNTAGLQKGTRENPLQLNELTPEQKAQLQQMLQGK